MPSSIPISGLDRTVTAFIALIVVCVIAAAAVWFARLAYAPHRIPEFSRLSAEQIQRRKAVYELVRWVSGMAVLVAVLMLLRACTS